MMAALDSSGGHQRGCRANRVPKRLELTARLRQSVLKLTYIRCRDRRDLTIGAFQRNRAINYLLGMALIRSGEVAKGQALVDGILRDGGSAEAHFVLGTVRTEWACQPVAFIMCFKVAPPDRFTNSSTLAFLLPLHPAPARSRKRGRQTRLRSDSSGAQ